MVAVSERDDDEKDEAPIAATALELRRPDVPVDLNELAARKSEAVEIIEARADILAMIRKKAILATSPEDWVLFKAGEEHGGQVVAYLQDCGAERVRDLYGIEIRNVSKPEKVLTNDPAVFHYIVRGDGLCKLTRQALEDVEGGRSSTEDFCKGKTGVDLELAVRKAARANLDGGITRELAGLKSVPLDEIAAVWQGTPKKIENCRKGRGFGTRDQRLGAETIDADIVPPKCHLCQKPMKLRQGSKGPFYSCPDYKDHGSEARVMDFEKWKARPESKKQPAAPTTAAAPASTTTNGKTTPPTKVTHELTDDDVFGSNRPGRSREPGQEG